MNKMEEAFGKIVEHIFNNWSALKLAVDHSMGGSNSKQTALDCMNYIIQFCLYESNIDAYKIQEALEDLMDEEFETLCEDDSPKEIGTILYRFVQLLKDGNLQQCEEEFQKLPVMGPNWINSTVQQVQQNSDEDSSSESEKESNGTADVPMAEDGWTQVKSKKKR